MPQQGGQKGIVTFFCFGRLLVTILSLVLGVFGHSFAYPLLPPPFGEV